MTMSTVYICSLLFTSRVIMANHIVFLPQDRVNQHLGSHFLVTLLCFWKGLTERFFQDSFLGFRFCSSNVPRRWWRGGRSGWVVNGTASIPRQNFLLEMFMMVLELPVCWRQRRFPQERRHSFPIKSGYRLRSHGIMYSRHCCYFRCLDDSLLQWSWDDAQKERRKGHKRVSNELELLEQFRTRMRLPSFVRESRPHTRRVQLVAEDEL